MVGWPGIIVKSEKDKLILAEQLWEHSMIPIFFEKDFIERVID
jgi:hypothetical protein